ncbi:adenylate kinase [Nocardia sp. NPDC003693]
MQRVVVLGRGGAGKSRFAARLGAVTGVPVIELDKLFWPPDLTPLPAHRWREIQQQLVSEKTWILDGDLGPYDVLEVRLAPADTVVVLDFSLWRCAWQAARRSQENLAFWSWVVTYRRRSLPAIMAALREHAGTAEIHVLRGPDQLACFLARAARPWE